MLHEAEHGHEGVRISHGFYIRVRLGGKIKKKKIIELRRFYSQQCDVSLVWGL